jgi:hypothetical protein
MSTVLHICRIRRPDAGWQTPLHENNRLSVPRGQPGENLLIPDVGAGPPARQRPSGADKRSVDMPRSTVRSLGRERTLAVAWRRAIGTPCPNPLAPDQSRGGNVRGRVIQAGLIGCPVMTWTVATTSGGDWTPRGLAWPRRQSGSSDGEPLVRDDAASASAPFSTAARDGRGGLGSQRVRRVRRRGGPAVTGP